MTAFFSAAKVGKTAHIPFIDISAPAWHTQAACRNEDPELFYVRVLAPEAKEVCGGCPVREQCLEAFRDDAWAVAGGYTAAERRHLKSKGQL